MKPQCAHRLMTQEGHPDLTGITTTCSRFCRSIGNSPRTGDVGTGRLIVEPTRILCWWRFVTRDPMHRVLLLGAGTIGRMIAKLLSRTGDYEVLVDDVDERLLQRIPQQSGTATRQLDAQHPAEVQEGLRN